MKKLTPLLLAGMALLAGSASQASNQTSAEKRLARILEGRVAGEPVECLKIVGKPEMKVVGDAAIIYGSGKTVYVTRTQTPSLLGSGDEVSLAKLVCQSDKVALFRPYGVGYFGLPLGASRRDFVMTEFVPYHRKSRLD